MQSTGPGPQSFQLVRRAHQAESYEIWDGQSSAGQPVAMVLLPPVAANDAVARSAFGATVAWAQRPDNRSVAVLSHDVIGPTPWVAIVPDPQGRAVWSFVQQLQASTALHFSAAGPVVGAAHPGVPAPRSAPESGADRTAVMAGPGSLPPVRPIAPSSGLDEQAPTAKLDASAISMPSSSPLSADDVQTARFPSPPPVAASPPVASSAAASSPPLGS